MDHHTLTQIALRMKARVTRKMKTMLRMKYMTKMMPRVKLKTKTMPASAQPPSLLVNSLWTLTLTGQTCTQTVMKTWMIARAVTTPEAT
jgi:hypothetical protein